MGWGDQVLVNQKSDELAGRLFNIVLVAKRFKISLQVFLKLIQDILSRLFHSFKVRGV